MCSRSLFLSPSCTYTHTHWGKEAEMTSRVTNVTFFCLARWIICLTPRFASSGAIYIQYYFSTLFHPPSADKRDPNMNICLQQGDVNYRNELGEKDVLRKKLRQHLFSSLSGMFFYSFSTLRQLHTRCGTIVGFEEVQFLGEPPDSCC